MKEEVRLLCGCNTSKKVSALITNLLRECNVQDSEIQSVTVHFTNQSNL